MQASEVSQPTGVMPIVNKVYQGLMCVYALLLTFLMPIIYDNNFIRISSYKSEVFTAITLVAVAISLLYGLIRLIHAAATRSLRPPSIRNLRKPDVALFLFVAVSAVSCLLSEDPAMAFTGIHGRKTGLLFILLLASEYFIFKYVPKGRVFSYYGLLASGAFVSVLAVLNFLGFDPLNMYHNLVPGQHEMFISTVGNRNFFAAYLCIYLTVCMCLCVFRRGVLTKLAWISIPLGCAAVLAARSDSAFAGLGVAFVGLFLCSLRSFHKLVRFIVVTVILYATLLVMRPLYAMFSERALMMPDCLAGDLLMMKGIEWLSIPLLLALVTAKLIKPRRSYNAILKRIQKIGTIIIVTLGAAAVASVIYFTFIDIHTPLPGGLNNLRFSDAWGNWRGYVWTRSIERYMNYTPLQKLFGCGPDLMPTVMGEYSKEMVRLTGANFDNCHNEFIQYLITTGILGAASYTALLFFIINRLRRTLKLGDEYAAALFLPIIAYTTQSLFNISQPAATPTFFLFLGLASGFLLLEEKRKHVIVSEEVSREREIYIDDPDAEEALKNRRKFRRRKAEAAAPEDKGEHDA